MTFGWYPFIYLQLIFSGRLLYSELTLSSGDMEAVYQEHRLSLTTLA